MYEVFARGAKVGPDVKREQLQTALRGPLEDWQLKYLSMEVHRHVSTELLWKLLQRLEKS